MNSNHVYGVHLPAFNARLANLARDAGAEIIYGARYKRLIRECSEIKGIVYEKDGAEYEAFGKLIADASGISSAVRRDIDSLYMETFEIGPLDRFTSCSNMSSTMTRQMKRDRQLAVLQDMDRPLPWQERWDHRCGASTSLIIANT